jgi:hypothetical protein
MDSRTTNDFSMILQNVLSSVDENKEKLNNKDYLIITNNLQNLHKLMDSNFYEITFITMEYQRCGFNSLNAIPKRRKSIIRMTNEEYELLKANLEKTNYFVPNCCQPLLEGIKDRLNLPHFQEFNALYKSSSINDTDIIDDLTDPIVEINLYNRVVFLDCVKL